MLDFAVWNFICRLFWALPIILFPSLTCLADSEGTVPFTVKDSIEMVRLADPNLVNVGQVTPVFNMSSDGKHFVLVTSAGNLGNLKKESTLTLYNTQDVLEYVNGGASFPKAVSLIQLTKPISESSAKFETANEARIRRDAIRDVSWLNDNTVVFLGEFEGRPRQIYGVDIQTKEVTQYTDHPRSITTFEVDNETGRILFAATVPHYQDLYGKRSFVTGTKRILFIRDSIHGEDTNVHYQYHTMQMGQPDSVKKIGVAFSSVFDISLSPNGRWAVGITQNYTYGSEPLAKLLKKYSGYSALMPYAAEYNATYDDYTMGAENAQVWQYVVYDLENGSHKPLFDAPIVGASNNIKSKVVWNPDDGSVFLAMGFLPLSDVDDAERKRRSQLPAIIEYTLDSGEFVRVVDHQVSVRKNGKRMSFKGIKLLEDGILKVETRATKTAPGISHFQKVAGEWVAAPRAVVDSQGVPRKDLAKKNLAKRDKALLGDLELYVYQDLNTAPEVGGRDTATGYERIFTNLNPQFSNKSFGHAEAFRWEDKGGRQWLGGLLYPVGYEAGTRYPLVIQTHGFKDKAFLLDGIFGAGAVTPPYAAQMLANRGIMVLQFPDILSISVSREELLVHRAGAETAIDKLDKLGLIDRDKVGLVGYSRTGLYVGDLITYSDYKFAAAITSDSYSLSTQTYLAGFGSSSSNELFKLTEANPWGSTLDKWVERMPFLQTDKVRTPLRIEEYNSYGSGWWETYVFMRGQHKPVEHVIYPFGSHPPVDVLDQFVSMQGGVDWFDFWLNGRERTTPYTGTPETKEGLAEQYGRWRQLKDLQPESEAAALKARG